jgi:hypothetical protein
MNDASYQPLLAYPLPKTVEMATGEVNFREKLARAP